MKKIILILTLILSSYAFCQSAEGYYNLSRYKVYDGDLSGAITLLGKAIELEKDPINLRSNYSIRADLKLKIKDYSGAIADYTKVEALGERDDNLYLNRAKAKNELKDYRGALNDYDRYLKKNSYMIDPNSEKQNRERFCKVYLLRGNVKFNLRDLQGAKADYDNAISLDPTDALVFYNRGLLKIEFYQKSSACLDFSKAGELGMTKAYDAIKQYCN